MATYDRFKDKHISFDIETTGIDPGNYFGESIDGISVKKDIRPRIWQTAFYDPTTGKAHEVGYKTANAAQEYGALSGVEFYQRNKAWQEHFSNNDRFKFDYTEVDKGINQSLKETNFRGGMILIQNAKFENRWMAHVMSEGGKIDFMDNLRYRQIRATDSSRRLYIPNSVTELKGKINRDKMSVAAIDAIYDKIIQQYAEETEVAAKAGKIVVGDLMDFTQATFTKAVNRGLLDEAYLTKGQNVELLAQVFLGEKEVHAAGSDASQQSRLLEELLGLRDRLSSGDLTPGDHVRINHLNRAKDSVRQLASAKGVSGLIESVEEGKPNVSGPVLRYREIQIEDSVTGEVKSIDVPIRGKITGKGQILTNYLENARSNEGTIAYEEVRKAVAEFGPEDALEYIQTDEFKSGLGKIKEVAQEDLDSITGPEEAPRKTISGDIDSGTEKISNKAKKAMDKFSEHYKDMKNEGSLLSALMPDNPKTGLGVTAAVTAVGGLWAISQFNSEENAEEYLIKRRQREVSLYPESTFKMLEPNNRPELPYGYARANWENRIGHHEYR